MARDPAGPETEESRRTRRWRRITFRTWVGATILVGIYVAIAGPLAYAYGREFWLAAVIVPPLMIFLLLVGLAYLAVRTNRGDDGSEGGETGGEPARRDRGADPGSAAKSSASLGTPTPTSGTRR
jgi:hypothetical protein